MALYYGEKAYGLGLMEPNGSIESENFGLDADPYKVKS
jgi:hypothetical protein